MSETKNVFMEKHIKEDIRSIFEPKCEEEKINLKETRDRLKVWFPV